MAGERAAVPGRALWLGGCSERRLSVVGLGEVRARGKLRPLGRCRLSLEEAAPLPCYTLRAPRSQVYWVQALEARNTACLQDQRLPSGLGSPAARLSALSGASPAPLPQPTTPQVPSARHTPGLRLEENARTQQQQQGAGEARCARTPAVSTGGRPRSVAELHAALGSQQRLKRTRQQSIATFLSPPLPAAPAAAAAAPAAAAAATTAAAAPVGSPGSAAPAGKHRKLPLSPRLKRLRVSFEASLAGVGGGDEAGGQSGSGRKPSNGREGPGGGPAHVAAAAAAAAAAASQLEPSPVNAPPSAPQLSAATSSRAAAGAAGAVCSPRRGPPQRSLGSAADENAKGNAA